MGEKYQTSIVSWKRRKYKYTKMLEWQTLFYELIIQQQHETHDNIQ